MSFEDGALIARGSASHDWIVQTRRLAQLLPGVTRLAEDGLVDLDLAGGELESVKREIERSAIRFATGSFEITPDQREELDRVSSKIQRLELLSQSQAMPVRVEVLGHADQSGSQELNNRLIDERAEQVVSALTALGTRPAVLEIPDSKASGRPIEYSRTVTFNVKIGAGGNK
jgi:OOP family OmpA-OmpF porin